MDDSLILLGKALALLREEVEDMARGDIDAAEEKFERRAMLMDRAWEGRHGAPPDEFRSMLVQMQELQDKLSEDAERFKENLRQKLVDSRQETRRIAGYRQAVAQAVRYQ